MQEKWIPATDFLEDEILYGEGEKFIDYKPDDGRIILPKERTGWREEQVFETESGLGWHLANGRFGEVCLISHEATISELTLRGKVGYDNVKGIISEYCRELYSNKQLMAEGTALTRENIKSIPDYIRKYTKRRYWLASRCVYYSSDYARFIVFYVNSGSVYANSLYYSYGHANSISYAVRPVVHLPSNILVNVGDEYFDGSTHERGLQIKLEEKL